MDTAAQSAHLDRVLQVEHLVVEQVFDCVPWARWPVEDAADDDHVVGRVIVAQRPLSKMLAPGEIGPAEQPAEEARIEGVEDFFEIVEAALWTKEALRSE